MAVCKKACSKCGVVLTIPEGCTARKGRCRACGEVLLIEALPDAPAKAAMRSAIQAAEDSVSGEDIASWLGSGATQDSRETRTRTKPRKVPRKHKAPRSAGGDEPSGPAGGSPADASRTTPHPAVDATAPGPEQTDVPADPKAAAAAGRSLRPHFRLWLHHVDTMGAFFRFDARLLFDEDFRSSFPQKCITCGKTDDLTIHLIDWFSKHNGGGSNKTGYHMPCVHELKKFANLSRRDLLSVLGRVNTMPEPFCLAFPYYLCRRCTSVGALVTDVRPSPVGQGEICELGIASVEQAHAFAVENLGPNHEISRKLREVAEEGTGQAWRLLPLAVRNRIKQWYQPREDETFLAYIPDADFSAAEAGKAGVVVTDKRLVSHKLLSVIEMPLTERIDIERRGEGEPAKLNITSQSGQVARLTANAAALAQLEKLISEHSAAQRV